MPPEEAVKVGLVKREGGGVGFGLAVLHKQSARAEEEKNLIG